MENQSVLEAERALGEELSAETFEHNKDTDGKGGRWFQVLSLEAPLVWWPEPGPSDNNNKKKNNPEGEALFREMILYSSPPRGGLVHWDRPKEGHTLVRAAGVTLFFCKRIPKINANQKKKQKPKHHKEWQKQTKKNPNQMWLEGGGEEDKSAGVEGREAVTSLRPSFSFRAAALPPPLLWNCVAWMEGWIANDRPVPPLLCFSLAPAQLSGPGWS